jgi:hypothetical protein
MGDQNITYFNPVLSAEVMLSLNAVRLQAATTDCQTVLIMATAPDSKLVCPDTSLFLNGTGSNTRGVVNGVGSKWHDQ